MRLHEFAKMYSLDRPEMIGVLKSLGFKVKDHPFTVIGNEIISKLEELKENHQFPTIRRSISDNFETNRRKIGKKKFELLLPIFKDFKIYVDSCSFLTDFSKNSFLGDFFNLHQYCNSMFIIPDSVPIEINKHKDNANYSSALEILEKYRKEKFLKEVSFKNTSIPDHFFVLEFLRTYCSENFCLVTQDKNLIDDIFKITLKSVISNKLKAFIFLEKNGFPYFSCPEDFSFPSREFFVFKKNDNSLVEKWF